MSGTTPKEKAAKVDRIVSRHDDHAKAYLFTWPEKKDRFGEVISKAGELEQSGHNEADARQRAWQFRHEEPESVTELKGK